MNTAILLSAQGSAAGSGMGMIIMLVLLFAIMWFFMVRPQQKKQKEIRAFQNSLEVGSKVVTGGGIYGTVKSIDQASNKVDIEIARGVVITLDKGYVFKSPQDTAQAAK